MFKVGDNRVVRCRCRVVSVAARLMVRQSARDGASFTLTVVVIPQQLASTEGFIMGRKTAIEQRFYPVHGEHRPALGYMERTFIPFLTKDEIRSLVLGDVSPVWAATDAMAKDARAPGMMAMRGAAAGAPRLVHRLWVYVVAAYGVTVMDGLEHVVQARLIDDDGCELGIDLEKEGLALQLEGCVDREFEFDGELTIPDAVFESNVLSVPVSVTGTGGAAVMPRGYILGRVQVVCRCFSVEVFADEAWVHRTCLLQQFTKTTTRGAG